MRLLSVELDELLTEVLATQHPDECARRVFEAMGHGFSNLDSSVLHPAAEVVKRAWPKLHPIGHDETLQPDAVREQRSEVPHAIGLRDVVLRDHSAQRN